MSFVRFWMKRQIEILYNLDLLYFISGDDK